MAHDGGVSPTPQPPELLVLGPPVVFRLYDKEFSSRFRILRPWESPLPLLQFVAAEAQHTQAAFCPGGFPVSADLLRSLPSLRLLVSSSAGVDHIDLSECRRRGVKVAHGPEVFSEDVADLAVGLLLDVLRKISAGNRFVKNGFWPIQGPYPFGSKREEIAGAGLDVFEDEPHVPQELFELDNVVLSPHCAVFTEQSCRGTYELMFGNLEAFFSNKPLLSVISMDQNN